MQCTYINSVMDRNRHDTPHFQMETAEPALENQKKGLWLHMTNMNRVCDIIRYQDHIYLSVLAGTT